MRVIVIKECIAVLQRKNYRCLNPTFKTITARSSSTIGALINGTLLNGWAEDGWAEPLIVELSWLDVRDEAYIVCG